MKNLSLNKKIISFPINMKLAIMPYVYCKTANFTKARLDDTNRDVQVKEWIIEPVRVIDTFKNSSQFIKEFNIFCWEVVFHTTEGAISSGDFPATMRKEATDGTINPFFHQGTWIGRFSYKKLSLNTLSFNSTTWAESVVNDSKKMWFIHLISLFANIDVEFPSSFVAPVEFLNKIETKKYGYDKAKAHVLLSTTYNYESLDTMISKLSKDSTKFDKAKNLEEEVKVTLGLAHPDILSLMTTPTDYSTDEEKLMYKNFENSLNEYVKELKTYHDREMEVISNNAENTVLTSLYLKLVKSNDNKLAKNNLSCCSRRHVPFYTSLDREESTFCVNKITPELNVDFSKNPYILGYTYAITISNLISYSESYKLLINNHTLRMSSTGYGIVDNDNESLSYLDDKSGTVEGFSNIDYKEIMQYWRLTETGRTTVFLNGTSNLIYTCDLTYETICVNKLSFSRASFVDFLSEKIFMGLYTVNFKIPRINLPLLDLRTNVDEFSYTQEVGGTATEKEYKHEYVNVNAYETDQAEKMIDQPIEVMLPMYYSTVLTQLIREVHLGDLHIPLFTSDVLFPELDDLTEEEYEDNSGGIVTIKKRTIYSSFVQVGRLKQKAKTDEVKFEVVKPLDLVKIKIQSGYRIKDFHTLSIKLGVSETSLVKFINTIIASCIVIAIERQGNNSFAGSKLFMKKFNKRIVNLRNRLFALKDVNIDNDAKISVNTPSNRAVNLQNDTVKATEIANDIDKIKVHNTVNIITETASIPDKKEMAKQDKDEKNKNRPNANLTELGTDSTLEGEDVQ